VVEVVITDTGPGIPSQDLPHIFDPFFTTRGMVGGTGLGLAICREIVLSHRGEIRVESALGQGTRFIVSLPQSKEQDHRHTAGVLAGVEDHHGNGKA
jgi:signal transduction histidine kinase